MKSNTWLEVIPDLSTHTIFAYSVHSFKPEYASMQTWNLIRQKQLLIYSFFVVESRARQKVQSRFNFWSLLPPSPSFLNL